jgi:hypothetical protein
MVMFKARFKPMVGDKPSANDGGARPRPQQQQQPQPTPPHEAEEKAPPIEKEQGPQAPVKLPGAPHEPVRALAELSRA